MEVGGGAGDRAGVDLGAGPVDVEGDVVRVGAQPAPADQVAVAGVDAATTPRSRASTWRAVAASAVSGASVVRPAPTSPAAAKAAARARGRLRCLRGLREPVWGCLTGRTSWRTDGFRLSVAARGSRVAALRRRLPERREGEDRVGPGPVLVRQGGQPRGELLGERLARRQCDEPAAPQVRDRAAGAAALAVAGETGPRARPQGTRPYSRAYASTSWAASCAVLGGRVARTASMSLPTLCEAPLSTVVTYVPPGRSTRAHSATMARTFSAPPARCSSHTLDTASNSPSAKGSRRLSASTTAPGSRAAARHAMAGARSTPVTRRPSRPATIRRVTMPVPQATSSSLRACRGTRLSTARAAAAARGSPPRESSYRSASLS
ncbi:hypothetical protein SVIOM342S_09194 [Streptomyces violaceorubidus]